MKKAIKISSILFFLSLITSSHGQTFTFADSANTTISNVTYRLLPIQSEENFNFLCYSTKNKKQDFELLVLKDTLISKMELKNRGLDGGGSAYKSAVMSNKKLLLLHVDGFLLVYIKNKKGNYILKETLTIKGKHFNTISLLDDENVLLMNSYNYYNEEKLYDNYVLCVFNLPTKKVVYSKEMDLGKGILLSHFSSTVLIESKKDKIAMAHPTLPLVYIYNDKLNPIDTIYAQFQDSISVDSVINTVFTDSFLERNRTRPKEIIETIENGKINQMERIEKVFWLSDDIVGYIIRQAFSQERRFVFYSIAEKRELYDKIDSLFSGNFVSSTRVLINNNKTIWNGYIHNEDKSDIYYQFMLYGMQPLNGTK